MSFTVEWRPSADDELARLWVDHPAERNQIAAAAALDTALRRDPSALGESRAGAARVACEGPLAIAFDVFPNQHRVLVKAVWRSR